MNRVYKLVLITLHCLLSHSLMAQQAFLYLCPQGNNILRTAVTNNTDSVFEIHSPWLVNDNNITAINLEDQFRSSCEVGDYADPIPDEFVIKVFPGDFRANLLQVSETECCFPDPRYESLVWTVERLMSNTATLTLNHVNMDTRPCPSLKETKTMLLLVLHRYTKGRNDSDVGFLVLNGSNAAVSVAQPLFNDSRLVVHAPKIGYSNEVFAVDTTATNATVAARGTTEWRVPWTNLWNRLPAADRTSLTNAHEVDLYWRSGEFTSEALPLWIE